MSFTGHTAQTGHQAGVCPVPGLAPTLAPALTRELESTATAAIDSKPNAKIDTILVSKGNLFEFNGVDYIAARADVGSGREATDAFGKANEPDLGASVRRLDPAP